MKILKASIIVIFIFIFLNVSLGQSNKKFCPNGYYFTETVIQNNEWIFFNGYP